MNFQERKKLILAAIRQAGSLTVFQLAEKLGTSTATIRRDLHDISAEGLLLRTHGGAMQPDMQPLTAFIEKAGVRDSEKDRIARLAAGFVQEGDTLFLDCGSTVYKMCRYLKGVDNIRIVTNSIPVLAAFVDAPGIQINLVGGEIDKKRLAAHGLKAIEHISSYHADKAFIGVDGISPETGLTAHSEHEASITSAFIAHARENFLLCDSSKIGRDSYLRFAGVEVITTLVTDSEADVTSRQHLTEKGVRILLA
ncbi:DeoR/GlpR family DNA-binding transcription regulator [Dyadobacter sandarakinus]|uniref:DeoR/GlpR transcriptional regulator n=1 Tax=Dyadobacter sandarakinus TaxID=2747268 RepID=A0ABX7I5H7_9BACT|nr:DeoR/GlpR family DNA-binding transcription regulator [Dyadobacter sandarakinus]QRR01124.1 DeoR/GlpR transcriptional regulator [Dyadobacter sandarakinus]